MTCQIYNHNFAGGFCLNCKISQDELSKKFAGKKENPIKEYKIPAPNKNLHSEEHCLADELYSFFGKKDKFGFYLGIIKKFGKQKAREVFSEIKQSKNIREPQKLFAWMCKNK